MSQLLKCPQGHQWSVNSLAESSGQQAACPFCGALGFLAASDTAEADCAETGAPRPSRVLTPAGGAEAETVPPLLPPRDAGEVTTVRREQSRIDPSTDPITLPGYEILGELGRGGMGVVYKARQVQLNRVVALKMILTGAHAGPQDLARFRTEAEAVARLQHPHIIQIYEVGEQRGLPYFSLEFCPGGGLDKKLAGTPLPAAEAAALVEKLARAMQVAHQKGVLHRDLKPANVLLAEDGTPKVTDFGLAKKLGEAGQTQSGAVMGTPSYMAPEQAAAKAGEVGPATDVYSLGAILYECLTGRPPFKAPTALDTIMQVVSAEPVPPGQLNAKVPRDLETICLKCLQKAPGKRYSSAEAPADDLRRFQAREPIAARPVSVTERAWQWCRRNPAVAGLLVAVLFVFAAGATVSAILALLAERRAGESIKARGEAEREAEKALLKETEAVKARDDLQRANVELEKTLARSLLRPMGLLPSETGKLDMPLTYPEIEALWELASTSKPSLRIRFVDEASRHPFSTRQLRDRAVYALHAVVGLDLVKREQLQGLLRERLRGKEMDEGQRTDLAVVSAFLGGLSPQDASVVAQILVTAMAKTKDPLSLRILAEALGAVSERLNATQAAALADKAAHALIAAFSPDQTTGRLFSDQQLEPLVMGLRVVSGRLDAAGASRAAQALLATMKRVPMPVFLRYLVGGLQMVSGRLDAAGARKVADTLITAMVTPSRYHHAYVAVALQTVSRRLDRAAASNAAHKLLKAMDERAPYFSPYLAVALHAVSGRLDPAQAAAHADKAARALVAAMKKTTNTRTLGLLAQGLALVLGQMEVTQAATYAGQAADPLLIAMAEHTVAFRTAQKQGSEIYALQALKRGLQALGGMLDKTHAGKAAQTLLAAIDQATDGSAITCLAVALQAVSGRLDETRAAVVAKAMTARMARTTDRATLKSLTDVMIGVSNRLEPAQAAEHAGKVAHDIIVSLNNCDPRSGDFYSRVGSLSMTLQDLSGLLDAAHADEAARALVATMGKSLTPYPFKALAQALGAVSGRLDAAQAAAYADKAARALIAAMNKTTDPQGIGALAEGLGAVLGRLESTKAANYAEKAMHALAAAMSKVPILPLAETRIIIPDNPNAAIGPLALGVKAVGRGLDPAAAAEAIAVLVTAISKATEPFWFDQDHSTELWFEPGQRREQMAEVLAAALAGKDAEQFSRRANAVAGAVGLLADTRHSFAIPAVLWPALGTFHRSFALQYLSELLKHPLCVGEARRVVLDELGQRYGRRFADHWAFVRFAQEHKLGLDFTTPPKRPVLLAAVKSK
jgi:hypothetical protein